MARTRVPDPDSEWLPVAQAAAEAGVPRRTAFRWVREGLVKCRENELGRLVKAESLRLLRAAPLSATRALRGTGQRAPPAYKILGLRHDPDETAEQMADWMDTVHDQLANLEKRLMALEKAAISGSKR